MGAVKTENSAHVRRRPLSSTYSTSYLPTKEGTRTRVWREGFDQRESRKQNGFRHVAIEWDVLTDRPDLKRYQDDEIKVEELFLPTSRIERKRRQLIREYDRAQKREERKKNELRKKLSIDDAGVIREMNINEYEKNKARNYKTNIQFPTPISTLRSQRSSRSSRSSSRSSAPPRRSRSAFQRQRSPEKSLESSLSRLSVKDEGRGLHLSQEQVNTLQEVAGQKEKEPSAMDKYLAMKTKQELDNISCTH